MSSGDTTQGRRLPDRHPAAPATARPGHYWRVPVLGQDGMSYYGWRAITPIGLVANLDSHEVTEHEDGTITVSPSIRVTTPRLPDGLPDESWHGFLERGVWREA